MVALCRTRTGPQYYLTNRSRTLIKINPRLKNFSLENVMVGLQELGIPFKYTDGLDVICFTIMTGTDRGWYEDGVIYIDVSAVSRDLVIDTFVHELGHHVDEQEDVSAGMTIERRLRYKHLRDPYSRKDNYEYVAVGFQKFYSGDHSDRQNMRKHNPRLYRALSDLHEQYKSKR